MKYHIGDHVFVCTGKDKGKTGNITRILLKQDRVIVDGINKTIRHVKGREGRPGERAEFFAPIDWSNIAIVDPKDGKPTRIGYKFDKGGQKIRIAKRSGEEIVPGTKAAKVAPKKTSKPKSSK
jgi:large subunit ribosomal protein L24